MNFLLPPLALDPVVIALAVTAILCTATLRVVRAQLKRHRQRVSDLEDRLVMFVEASINVAHSVQQLQSTDETLPRVEVHMPNRRWVLQEARDRLDAGEQMSDVAQPLGLSREEVSLLRLRTG